LLQISCRPPKSERFDPALGRPTWIRTTVAVRLTNDPREASMTRSTHAADRDPEGATRNHRGRLAVMPSGRGRPLAPPTDGASVPVGPVARRRGRPLRRHTHRNPELKTPLAPEDDRPIETLADTRAMNATVRRSPSSCISSISVSMGSRPRRHRNRGHWAVDEPRRVPIA
jgi:hypothetical protein